MRILYITCGENGLHGLKRLVAHGCEVVRVVTISPEVAAAAKVAGYADVAPWCASHGVPVTVLDDYKFLHQHQRDVEYELAVVNGWNRLIDPAVFRNARYGAIGVHAGHPPIGLGRAPLVWNIIQGHSDIEVYVFRLSENADDGPIVSLRPVEITHSDNADTLYQKVMFAGAELIIEAIDRLQRGIEPRAQLSEFAVIYPKRTPEDGLIDFRWNEVEISNFVRAQVPPYPGAFCYLDDKKWTLHSVVPFDRFSFRDAVREPGLIVASLPAGLVVLSGGSPVWVQVAISDADNLRLPDPLAAERFVGRRFVGRQD